MQAANKVEEAEDQSKSQLFTVQAGTHSIAPFKDAGGAELLACSSIIDNKYRVLELLGKGGMGAVYRVHHLQLRKDVALKTFLTSDINESAWVRFQREAQAIARLDHPNVVKVFDFGIDRTNATGLPFYTMELLKGESLSDTLRRQGRLSLVDAVNIFIQVSRGLAAVHDKGIVHGDIKPANIFLELPAATGLKQNRARIVDFGIASLIVDNQNATQSGEQKCNEIFGSPLYMSPEQFTGKQLTAASDIYSAGCALFETLTGRLPFFGATAMATMYLHLNEKPPTLSAILSSFDVPQRLEGLLSRMLAKNPEQRPESFAQIADELSAVLPFLKARSGLSAASKDARSAEENEQDIDDYDEDEPQGNAPSNRFVKALPYVLVGAVLLAGATTAGLIFKGRLIAAPKIDSHTIGNYKTDTSDQGEKTTGLKQSVQAEDDDPHYSTVLTLPETSRFVDNRIMAHSRNIVPAPTQPQVDIKLNSFDRTSPSERAKKLRHFEFPPKISLGVFRWYSPTLQEKLARGSLIVPFDAGFEANESIEQNPEYLKGFAPDSLYSFTQKKALMFTDAHIGYLARLSALRSLTVIGAKISESSLPQLNNLKLLTVLDMQKCSISAEALTGIGALRNLTTLNISGLKNCGALLKHYSSWPSLLQLYAAHSGLKDSDMAAVATCPQLEQLILNDNLDITDTGMPLLLPLKKLHHLELIGTRVSPKATASLAQMKQLNLVAIEPTYWNNNDITYLKKFLQPNCRVDDH